VALLAMAATPLLVSAVPWRRTAATLARCAALGTGAISMAAVAQVVHMRTTYVSPADPEGMRHGRAGLRLSGRPLRVLFVGDSICMGVGASSPAPLQTACVDRLAVLRGSPVVWHTVAETGADVRTLRRLLLRSNEGRGFDIAIIFCGVNDGKQILRGRLPSEFRQDLSDLCTELKEAEPEGRIVLPCIPGYLCAPQLQLWPMRHLVKFFFSMYEAEKEAVAEGSAYCCPSPSPASLPHLLADLSLWADDGIHPSAEGYRRVGEWLGAEIASE